MDPESKVTLRKVGTGARWLLFPALGPMKQTVRLLKDEVGHANATRKELHRATREASEAVREAFRPAPKKQNADHLSFEAMMRQRKAGAPTWTQLYHGFLRRKRAAQCMCLFFSLLGLWSLVHGQWSGLLPLLIGGGFTLEYAWLTEFRLWQLRNRRLSIEEKGGLSDFRSDPGAWKGALRAEVGFGLDAPHRRYRRWLWFKRVGLVVAALGVLAFFDLFYSRSTASAPGALVVAALGLLCVLLIELRLSGLRSSLHLPHRAWVLVRMELGACYEETKS